MIAMMTSLGVALSGLVLASALTPAVDAAANRLRLQRRARATAMPVLRRALGSWSQRSSAEPILRSAGRASDAVIMAWLPGGATMAAALLAAGGRLSITVLTIGCAIAAALIAGSAIGLGLPVAAALLLIPLLAIGLARLVSLSLAHRARAAFSRSFPDAVATIIRSLRAGLPVTSAIAEVARGKAGLIANTFAGVVENMGLGQPIEAALWTAARRIGVAEFDFLVVTIALQRETGGNLAETLTGLDDTLRMRRQLALKVRALAAEARASAMIIGSLPFVMAALLWMTSPEYLLPLFTTTLGKAMLGGGLASIAAGGIIISQMMTIKS
jgi:tight adherence protein B